MKEIFNISRNFKRAEERDIFQYFNLSPDERIKIANELIINFILSLVGN